MRRALVGRRIFAGVHKADFVPQIVHITLVIVDENDIAMLLLERFIGQVDQTLGLAAALVAENYLYHGGIHSFRKSRKRVIIIIHQICPNCKPRFCAERFFRIAAGFFRMRGEMNNVYFDVSEAC